MTETEIDRLAEIVAARLRSTIGETSMLDARAAGERLGVPATWLLAQARARKIPHRRFGKYVRFDATDIDAIAGLTLCPPTRGR